MVPRVRVFLGDSKRIRHEHIYFLISFLLVQLRVQHSTELFALFCLSQRPDMTLLGSAATRLQATKQSRVVTMADVSKQQLVPWHWCLFAGLEM